MSDAMERVKAVYPDAFAIPACEGTRYVAQIWDSKAGHLGKDWPDAASRLPCAVSAQPKPPDCQLSANLVADVWDETQPKWGIECPHGYPTAFCSRCIEERANRPSAEPKVDMVKFT